MTQKQKFCLIGEVIVDVTLTPEGEENKLRFGGIFHAARALWALDVDYDLLFIAPDYLNNQIKNYAFNHGANLVNSIGLVTGAPNVIIINDAKETGEQGYDLLLRDEHCSELYPDILASSIQDNSYSDIVIFPGRFDLNKILSLCKGTTSKVHIDIAYNLNELNILDKLGKKFDTIFLSTSSDLFLNKYSGSVTLIGKQLLDNYCTRFVFKENRGGTRCYERSIDSDPILIEAQLRSVVHSVGVGDCFNVAYLYLSHTNSSKIALTYASWIASEYASTTFVDDFKRDCKRVISIIPETLIAIKGISLPWEVRPHFNIYIAAPDFDYLNRIEIEKIISKLQYHNFSPRLPIREHGQLPIDAPNKLKRTLFIKDLKLIKDCQILLAIMIGDDPGTLIEIGLASGFNIPVIVYDPYNHADNLMLTELPKVLSPNIDSVISEVFTIASRIHNER